MPRSGISSVSMRQTPSVPTCRNPARGWHFRRCAEPDCARCLRRNTDVDLFAVLQWTLIVFVPTADLDDFAVKRARLLDRPKFFFHMARPAGNSISFAVPRIMRPTALSSASLSSISVSAYERAAVLHHSGPHRPVCQLWAERFRQRAATLQTPGFNFPKWTCSRCPSSSAKLASSRRGAHRYRLGRERIDVELVNLFTGHDATAILSSLDYDRLACVLAPVSLGVGGHPPHVV